MEIYRNNGKISTNWYMKHIASGRLINYHSNQPIKQKTNTAKNLIDKVLKISSTQFKLENITKVKQLLLNNNYPIKLINTLIQQVTNNIAPRDNTKNKTSGNTKYYCLPYVPRLTEKNKIKEIIKEEEIAFAYKPNKTLQSLFTKTKTKIENKEQSDVVYEIKCEGKDNEECGRVYIGTTKRNLSVRINEHKSDIQKGKHSTALSQHCSEMGHKPDFDNVRILDKEKKHNKRYTLESLRIMQKSKCAINTKEYLDNCNASYTIAII